MKFLISSQKTMEMKKKSRFYSELKNFSWWEIYLKGRM